MPFSLAPLLIHNPDVPSNVRDALRTAYEVSADRRDDHLAAAARVMARELALECADARELVGLPFTGTC